MGATRLRPLRWTFDVTGWWYTRRWIVGVRRGEWWIGARHNPLCDWWEFGLLGLTVCVPAEKTPRRRQLPANVWHVPAGTDWCPRCGDTNYEVSTRICITCTWGDDGYADGRFANGWPGRPSAQQSVAYVPLLEPDDLTKQTNDVLYRDRPQVSDGQ